MKKLLILSITILILASCSSNDNNLDPFIGTWYFFSESGKEVDQCNKKSTLIVFENGNFNATNYGNQDNPNNCVVENTTHGTWINKGSNQYELKDNINGQVSLHSITFSNNSNIFKSEILIDNRIDIATFKRK